MSLKLNTKYLEGFVSEHEYEGMAAQVTAAHNTLVNRNGLGNDFLGWVTLPEDYDKEEFARLLVKMCQENSFKTIKFSTDFGYATRLNMRVYLWRDEIEGNEPVMTVDFEPIDWKPGYDIVNNPEMFELYVDGELVEYE